MASLHPKLLVALAGAALAAAGLTGCGGALSPTSLGLPALDPGPVVASSPTEVYARVAGGAMGCWFGPEGALRATHIFHADAASPSAGGAASIVIHERDPSQPNPRGARAFLISITGDSGLATIVATQSPRFADDKGEAMRTDVLVWANGGTSCAMQKFAPPAPVVVAPAEPPAKAKKKTLAKAL